MKSILTVVVVVVVVNLTETAFKRVELSRVNHT